MDRADRRGPGVTHRLWITLWKTCGGPALCCGSQCARNNGRCDVDEGAETYAGGPVNALRRIAFLLERSRAETYKVKAFRSAADTILPLGDEVAERVREGTLRKLPGIGASTAEVIEAAVEGRTPDRLAKLERETGGSTRPGRGGASRPAARRPALAQRLVRRRLSDRGDGVHRDRARPRLPGADRPLAPADGRQRAVGGPADPPARGRRGDQRAPRQRRRARSAC